MTPGAPATGKRIVVVDDEEVVRDFVACALEIEGYEVASFGEGAAALTYLADHPVDAILADCFMPGMDGRQLYDAIDRLGPALARKVIFISGNTRDERVEALLQDTGAQALQKPFHVADVVGIVQRIISEAR